MKDKTIHVIIENLAPKVTWTIVISMVVIIQERAKEGEKGKGKQHLYTIT